MCRDSVVGIATHYGLDGPGMDSQWGRGLPHPPPSVLYNEYCVYLQVLKRPRRGADHPSHQAPRLKKEDCIPPLALQGMF